MEFPLLGRLDGPSVAPEQLVRLCKSYREAVRYCWELRRTKRMTKAQLAAEAGLTAQHVSDYLAADDKPSRRSLPGEKVAEFEAVCGNSLITQWHAARAKLTCLKNCKRGPHDIFTVSAVREDPPLLQRSVR
jgi:hypothetical protein